MGKRKHPRLGQHLKGCCQTLVLTASEDSIHKDCQPAYFSVINKKKGTQDKAECAKHAPFAAWSVKGMIL